MRILQVCACFSILSLTALPAVAAPAEEFRGAWVTRFEWARPDAHACRKNIDEIMKTLAQHRFNAVIFQVRGQCDTLYPSPEEPWSPMIAPDGGDPGFSDFDPLAHALQAAHSNGLEFHAYINTHVAWQSAQRELPAASSHVFYQHFNAADPNACDSLACDADGRPIQWGEDDYAWIAPGVPAAQAYIRRQIMHIVKNYEIDGVHLDRIRTGGAEFSHDPISMARLNSAQANPYQLSFDAWTCDQITRFCRDLYAQIAEIKPGVKLSSAPLALTGQDRYPEYPADFHYAIAKAHQDAQAWLAAGAMDFVVPQIYWSDGDRKQPDFSRVLPDWINHAAGRHIYAGVRGLFSSSEIAHQINVTRSTGGMGNVIFSYADLKRSKRFSTLSRRGRGAYATAAQVPAMPWKEPNTASEGIILGRVADAQTNEPVVDAQVRRTGSDEVALTSADGIYSFLKVAPGRLNISILKPGWSELRIEDVDIAAGQVIRVNAALHEASATGETVASQPEQPDTPVTATQPEPALPKVKVISREVHVERPALTVIWWMLGILLGIGALIAAAAVWVMFKGYRKRRTLARRYPRGRKRSPR